MAVNLEDVISEQLENVVNVFSAEDKEFNRRMVDAGNYVSGTIRGNLHVGSLGGKVLRCSTHAGHDEDDFDFTSKVLENY